MLLQVYNAPDTQCNFWIIIAILTRAWKAISIEALFASAPVGSGCVDTVCVGVAVVLLWGAFILVCRRWKRKTSIKKVEHIIRNNRQFYVFCLLNSYIIAPTYPHTWCRCPTSHPDSDIWSFQARWRRRHAYHSYGLQSHTRQYLEKYTDQFDSWGCLRFVFHVFLCNNNTTVTSWRKTSIIFFLVI